MIHLVKLCVGVASFEELASYREERAHWWDADYGDDVHVHRTRLRPKRHAEIAGQGSIYWVIAGVIRCRQPILRLLPVVDGEGVVRCDIVMAPDLVRVVPRPRAAFQGWRYLEAGDAPADLAGGAAEAGSLAEDLARLGLI